METRNSPLICDFAAKDPVNFARSLSQSSAPEIDTILRQLPPSAAAGIVSKLPSNLAAQLLLAENEEPLKWIQQGPLEDVKAMLVLLPLSKRKSLVRKLPDRALRQRLLRFFSYPRHSLGRSASSQFLSVPVDIATSEVIDQIKAAKPGLPVVAVDADARYVGLLDARKVLEGNAQISIRNFVDTVRPLTAESSLVDAAELELWRKYSVLAVIDHVGQVLGVISQDDLLTQLGQGSDRTSTVNSVTKMFNLFVQVMTTLSLAMFSLRNRR